ncbi:lipopolysaccharide export system protein LptA [Tistlia consotensis]|uniref:Lipopolysaccharide export system protein LptA n=1 Tax=Tistlia consotensis USBA 355 TaxID=560819 RepID=A0A1Y6B6D1_9PROT|nr:LptA/OstA family protein [Tistlia consotensis]SME93175.1 lipopolysaccharide export system protein LptA [Tistlia consotensis USBA 355]SNR28469.1 lipopolysaccharide export system protein LptA [Tistlia consotensis]
MRGWWGLLLAAPLAAVATLAAAQGLSTFDTSQGDKPLLVDARDGIEWYRDQKIYVARGDAVATRGDTKIEADVLTAHYREQQQGGTQIYRVEADGHVVIHSNTDRAQGDFGVYSIDDRVMVLTGKDLRYETPRDLITARDSLEYWEDYKGHPMAVARGDALVESPKPGVAPETAAKTQSAKPQNAKSKKAGEPTSPFGVGSEGGRRRIQADVMTALIGRDKDGRNQISRIDAYDHVRIATATEFIVADKAVYYVNQERAILTGNVRITRGDNQLNGDAAEVDMKTGFSRLISSKDRVKGLLTPDGAQDLQGTKSK